jgi:hypothetical protein
VRALSASFSIIHYFSTDRTEGELFLLPSPSNIIFTQIDQRGAPSASFSIIHHCTQIEHRKSSSCSLLHHTSLYTDRTEGELFLLPSPSYTIVHK